MLIYDPTLTNRSTHGDISATLPRDIGNGTVASDIPPLPPGLLHVEPCLIHEEIFREQHWHQVQALSEKGRMTISDKRPTYRNTEVHSDRSIQSTARLLNSHAHIGIAAPLLCQSYAQVEHAILVSPSAGVDSRRGRL